MQSRNNKQMKQILLLIVLFFSFLINAQVKPKPGIKAGLNMTNITNTNYDIKSDFYAGISLSLKFSDFYTLQPELIYSRQGARIQLDGGSNTEIELDYFSLAIANKFLLFKNSNLHAVIGSFIGYRVSDNMESSWVDIFGIFFNWDVGMFVGLDYELSQNFGVEVRYKRGFVDLPNINLTNQDHIQSNTVFQIGLNYKFGK